MKSERLPLRCTPPCLLPHLVRDTVFIAAADLVRSDLDRRRLDLGLRRQGPHRIRHNATGPRIYHDLDRLRLNLVGELDRLRQHQSLGEEDGVVGLVDGVFGLVHAVVCRPDGVVGLVPAVVGRLLDVGLVDDDSAEAVARVQRVEGL
eukprot:1634570-Rhodomonas_salina.1